jgi:hypothetical protein
MTTTFITTGIDQLQASPRSGGGWLISFRSQHEGLFHQLYANGRLVDWTDLPEQRQFLLPEAAWPREVCVAAVQEQDRATDLSSHLPSEIRDPDWIYNVRLARQIAQRRGDLVEVMGDQATGQTPEALLAAEEPWPAHLERWGFGEEDFGQDSFGFECAAAPGLGMGGFGGGEFGMDGGVMELDVPLQEEGRHNLQVLLRRQDGQVAALPLVQIESSPPPAPTRRIAFDHYDALDHQITLSIS